MASSEWNAEKQNKVADKSATASPQAPEPGFEPYREDIEPSVETFNLTKTYGKIKAVDNLNLKLFHGEIFALLGYRVYMRNYFHDRYLHCRMIIDMMNRLYRQNGAGKSSTLDLFVGFTAPTSGKATICGYDLDKHMVKIQAFTGFCPQSNHIYEDLTVKEHVLIFGRVTNYKIKLRSCRC
ncbi:unnamed protein product [Orchesella dallaii]|uniref:ABC transporter domain-containing protein n=1 Tax=Orchesella dallaii TaxID=48710 RepID=A0ABP1REQ9_9HEXA